MCVAKTGFCRVGDCARSLVGRLVRVPPSGALTDGKKKKRCFFTRALGGVTLHCARVRRRIM